MAQDTLPEELRETYRVERLLGKGAMGVVYLATEVALHRPVALKLLLQPGRSELAQRLQREAQVMARLEHPNLPRVYDFGTTAAGPFLAMEFVSGSSLERGLPEGVPPLELMLQVAEGLEAVHQAGLLHRDLKPANLLLEDGGRVLLMDLGLALDPDRTRLTATGLVGTPLFLAPEVARGDAPQGPASEWYAWGMTLYHLLEGAPPVDSHEFFRLLANPEEEWIRLDWTRTDPSSVEARIAEACLAVDPAERPQNLEDLRARLARLRGEEPEPGAAGVDTSGPVPRLASSSSLAIPAPTPRRVPVLAVLAACGALGLSGWMLVPGEREEAPARVERTRPGIPVDAALAEDELPGDYGRRARAALERARSLYLTRDDRVVGEEVAAAEDTPLLDPDPLLYRRRIHALPEWERWGTWIRAGGDPATLDAGTRADLAAVDAELRRRNIDPVFEPFLTLEPAAEGVVLRDLRTRLYPHVPDRVELEGWAATAGAALDLALEEARGLDEEFLSSPEGPVPGGEVIALGGFLGVADADDYLKGITARTATRVAAREWISGGTEQLRRGLVAGLRAVEEEEDPERRAFLSILFSAFAADLAPLYFTGVSMLTPAEFFGGSPGSPDGWLLVAEWERKAGNRVGHMGVDVRERLRVLGDLLARAATPAEAGRGRQRFARAVNRQLDELGKLREPGPFWEALAVAIEVTRRDVGFVWSGTFDETFAALRRFGMPPGLGREDVEVLLSAAREVARQEEARGDGGGGLLREVRKMEGWLAGDR